MSPFLESQAAFAKALMNATLAAPSDITRPTGETVDAAPQTKRFDVYRNNVFSTAVDGLAETFPAVQQLVGQEFFRAVARAYLEASPPSSPILTKIGSDFAAFLDGFPPAAGVPYLGDVARIEQARIDAHHAADADPITIAALAQIAPELVGDTRLVSHPSLLLIRSQFPAGSLWRASTDQEQAVEVDIKQAEDILILRPSLQVETAVLPAGGGAFLAALIEGQTIEEAAEIAASGEESFDLSKHLAGLFGIGAFNEAQIDPAIEEQSP